MKIAQIAVSKYMQKGMFARHTAKSAITVPGTIILRPSATKKRTVKRTTETDIDSEDSSVEEFLAKSVAHMRIKMVKKTYGLGETEVNIHAVGNTTCDQSIQEKQNL